VSTFCSTYRLIGLGPGADLYAVLYLLIRATLWTTGVGIALFPALQAAHSWPSINPFVTADVVNASGHFRDLFYVIVPAAALSISTVLEALCTVSKRVSEITQATVILALIVNILIMVSGLVGFMLIEPGKLAKETASFSAGSWAIAVGLTVSLITEISVSGALERQRRRARRLGTAS
jgi:hypothetical protein